MIEAWELDIGPHRFSYKELKQAVRGFRDKELLGFGGSGRVYKGTLSNSNTQVVVNRISDVGDPRRLLFRIIYVCKPIVFLCLRSY